MKQFLLALCALVVAPTIFFGCPQYVVRDTVAYQVELDQYNAWATKQADLLKGFVAKHCECDAEGVFTTDGCKLSADFILTIGARAEWHKAMSLYLAGIAEERPSKEPPAIPPSSTLCPGAPEPPPAPETPDTPADVSMIVDLETE